MVSVASWAHRALRGATGYHHCRDEQEYCERYRGWAEEDVIGVYENPGGISPAAIVFTERGMYTRGEYGTECVEFRCLTSVRGPDDKTGSGHIEIAQVNGKISGILVEGRKGQFMDVYSVVRFLNRVMEMNTRQPSDGGSGT